MAIFEYLPMVNFVLLPEEIQFLFLTHVQVFSCEISFIFRLKYRVVFLSFCFLVIVVLLIFVSSVLFSAAEICLSLLFFM